MRPQQTLFVSVAEPEGQLFFGRDDLLRYAGPSQLIASALVLRLLAQAFADLSPERPPLRSDIHVLTAFPGDGILDCVELVTRARTQGRLTINTEAGPPEASPALPGRFYFEVRIGSRARAYWPVAGIFTEEVRQRVLQFQDGHGTAAELED
ncbi:MAG: hypothetical protein RR758_06165, partial [Burkholderiaceae bacterium]